MHGEFLDEPVFRAAARHGLGIDQTPVHVDDADVDRLIAIARMDRLIGFIGAGVRDGAITASDTAITKIQQAWHDELLVSLTLEALVVRTAELFDDRAIDYRLTKGAAVAHIDYADPSVRTFGDVDLIVHPSCWSGALACLETTGWRRDRAPLPGDYDDRYGKGATLRSTDGGVIDLHRRFTIGRFGVTSRMEELFADRAVVHLAGREIAALSASDRLLHACYHALLGGGSRLRAYRDVAQLVMVSDADWSTTFARARGWNGEAVVAGAIVEGWRRLDLDDRHPAHRRASEVVVSRGDRRALRRFTDRRSFRGQALTAVPNLPAREIPRYLWVLAEPRLRRWRGRHDRSPRVEVDGE